MSSIGNYNIAQMFSNDTRTIIYNYNDLIIYEVYNNKIKTYYYYTTSGKEFYPKNEHEININVAYNNLEDDCKLRTHKLKQLLKNNNLKND